MSAAQPRFIWCDAAGRGRNRYVMFRCNFALASPARAGTLHVFADTRYRLLVNGQTVGHGPARFFPKHPEYDTHEIAPFLRVGKNTIALLINSAGPATFHSDTSVGGLMAWGQVSEQGGRTLELASDESWRSLESPGHRRDTPLLSFALNAAEYVDGRLMPVHWASPEYDDRHWHPATLHGHPEQWGALAARSIPLLDERRVLPRRRVGAFVGRAGGEEEVYSLGVTTAKGVGQAGQGRVAVLTYIHSARAQEVILGTWWGRNFVNGMELAGRPRADVSLRQDRTAMLQAGWNTFVLYDTVRGDYWDFFLALPKNAGLALSAEREVDSPHIFLIGGPWQEELVGQAEQVGWPLRGPEELPEALGAWQGWPRGKGAANPARQRAWLTFSKLNEEQALQVDVPALARQVGDNSLALLFDFGSEVLGRPVLELKAAAGTTVDLAYVERLRPDGVADVHGRLFVDMVERYIARAGRQQFQTFHPRGFRYLEVLIHGKLEAFELCDLALTRAMYPVSEVGSFECSDPILNEIWRVGRTTLQACMEDAYLDCPWRERGLYVGDILVQFFVNLAAFGDRQLFRRCIALFWQAQGESGLVPGGCHGLAPGRYPDYSALLPQALYDYWACTGDRDFLRQCQPHLLRLLEGLGRLTVPNSDLLGGLELDPYIDLCQMDKGGVNCALNCLYQRAFHEGSRILGVLGERKLAKGYAQRAERLAVAIRERFWDEARGVFVDRLQGEVAGGGPSVPANALPLLWDIATGPQAARALSWLVEAMRQNFRVPEPKKPGDLQVTPYFAYFALGALYRHGKVCEAQQFMRRNWGYMLDRGAWSWWEYFSEDGVGQSLCHAWSACPTHYLSTAVLGVTFPEAGNFHHILLRPQPGSLAWARGIYPHPAGPIHVRWEFKAGKFFLSYDVPPGVELTVAEPSPLPDQSLL